MKNIDIKCKFSLNVSYNTLLYYLKMYKPSSSHLVNFRKQRGGVIRKYLNVVDEYSMKFLFSNL